CKHIAATFYLLAERFDDDPFELLLWRGRSRADLLADLSVGTPDGAAVPDAERVGAARVLTDLPAVDVEAAVERFWLSPVPLRAARCCCAATWTPCPCRRRSTSRSGRRCRASCTPAVTTSTPRCSSARPASWPPGGRSCAATWSSCSSPARRVSTGPGS